MKLIKLHTSTLILILLSLGLGYAFAHNKAIVIPLGGENPAGSIGFYDGDVGGSNTITSIETLAGASLTAPTGGTVIVNTSVLGSAATAGNSVRCYITDTESTTAGAAQQGWSSHGPGSFAQISGTRGFNISAGESKSFYLRCRYEGSSGSASLSHPQLTAIFNPY